MILLPWYMYWISLSAAMFMGFVLCALLSVGGQGSIREEEKKPDDYVDWSKIPMHLGCKEWPDINWVFVEPDGTVDMQSFKPSIKDDDWETCVPIWTAPSDAIIGSLPPWRESLRRRPGRV